MRCATARDLGYDDLPAETRVCEDPPTDETGVAYVNVLSESMPACDRRTSMAASLDDVPPGHHCHVYCAQRSCHAATRYLREHADEVAARCEGGLTYLRNGALSMARDDLVDGAACHAQILSHNADADEPCLTCADTEDTARPIAVDVDGARDPTARFQRTDGVAPDWYKRSDIWGELPSHFACEPEYRNPPRARDAQGAMRLTMDVSTTGLPADALLAYWAAAPGTGVREAHAAYGDFSNRGIVRCRDHVCRFTLDPPGRYTAEGKNFRPHLHFTEWRGDRWDSVTKTVEFTPP